MLNIGFWDTSMLHHEGRAFLFCEIPASFKMLVVVLVLAGVEFSFLLVAVFYNIDNTLMC